MCLLTSVANSTTTFQSLQILTMGTGLEPTISVEFEVFGHVQGCGFTKYCKELCEQTNISGWIKNTKKGTLQGKLQGSRSNVEYLVDWLTNSGSPGSKVEKCELTNWQNLAAPDFKGFSIRF